MKLVSYYLRSTLACRRGRKKLECDPNLLQTHLVKSSAHFHSNSLRIDFGPGPFRTLLLVGLFNGWPSLLISENLSATEEAIIRKHPTEENRMSVYEKDFPDRTSVWFVSNPETGARAFLAGTVHSLKEADLPLPSPFYAAYHEADLVVTEAGAGKAGGSGGAVDTVQLNAWIRKNRRNLTRGRGHGAETLFQAETVRALEVHLGKDYAGLQRKSSFILFMKVIQRQRSQLPGIEDLFALQAKRDGKRILRLDSDTVDRTVLKVMDELLESYLTEVEDRGLDAVFLDAMKDSPDPVFSSFYREGDLVEMNAIYEAKKRAGGLFEETLPKRNRQWVEKIARMLGHNSPEVEYVLVGGAHLGGDEGLLQLMQDKGFKLQQLFGVDRPGGGKN